MTSENTGVPPRRIMYDTEFLEDGLGIDLISIGMVEDGGREFYGINRGAPWRRISEHEWLMTNVVPSLPRAEVTPANPCGIDFDHPDVMPREDLAERVRQFITEPWPFTAAEAGRPAQLWAWFGAYDHVALAWLFGPMINLPKGIPMFTCDLRAWQAMLGDPFLPSQPEHLTSHNALDDARFNFVRYGLLEGIASGRIKIERTDGGSDEPEQRDPSADASET